MHEQPTIRLTDAVRQVGGWPINMDAVADLLDRADTVLADVGGRDYTGPLTDAQIRDLGLERA